MIVIRRDSAMMFGQSSVSYGDIKLDADNIDMDLRNNTVFAVGTTDSLGDVTASPYSTKAAPTTKPPPCATTSSRKKDSSPTS